MNIRPAPTSSGFTLVELMVSMTLGLLVLAAISTLMVNTGQLNQQQSAIARMQENARFALNKMSSDIRMAGAQYCSSFASVSGSRTDGHTLRPLRILTEAALPWGLPARTTYVPAPPSGEAGLLSPRFFLQGHECTTLSTCTPALNTVGSALPVPPATGTTATSRAAGADVLTMRYLSGQGLPLATTHESGATALVLTASATGAPLNFVAGDLAMVSDCMNAEVFSALAGGTSVTPSGNSGANNDLRLYSKTADARVFNFTKDFLTVTYFLRLRTDADSTTPISTLVRQQNGQIQSISDGVERMEILYGVRAVDASGNVALHYLNAAQVQAGTSASGATLACLPQPRGVGTLETGCLWRQVETVDVGLLMNSVTNVTNQPDERFSFSAATPALVEAAPPAVLPSGLPRGRMIRKEFRTRINVHNFTY